MRAAHWCWGGGGRRQEKIKKAFAFKESASVSRFIQTVVHTFSLDRASTSTHALMWLVRCSHGAPLSSLYSQEGKALRDSVVVVVELSPTPGPSGPKPHSLWPS